LGRRTADFVVVDDGARRRDVRIGYAGENPRLSRRPYEPQMPFHTILHPTDFSEAADAAFAVACALAKVGGGKLILLHVAPAHASQMKDLVSAEEMDGCYRARMREMCRGLPADVSVECVLESGHVAATISRVARQRDCDAITLGAVGRTASKRMACGLVAEAVLRTAGCAVIAVGVPAGAGRMRIDR